MTLTMKSLFLVLAFMASLIFIGELTNVSAQDPFCTTGGGAGTVYCNAQTGNPLEGDEGIFNRILDVIYWLALVISVIGVMIGGIRYILSGGDAGKVAAARKMIIYSLVGLVVTLAAGAIVAFVVTETASN